MNTLFQTRKVRLYLWAIVMNRVSGIIISVFLMMLGGCTRGVWVVQWEIYRPKEGVRFPIWREPFRPCETIDMNYLYVTPPISYSDGEGICYLGFYGDGRVVRGCLDVDKIEEELGSGISWETAYMIGYYTTKGGYVEVEFFEPPEGGTFHRYICIVKPDTVEMRIPRDRNFLRLYIKSDYRLLRWYKRG